MPNSQEQKELSIGEIVNLVKEYWQYIWSKKLVVILVSIFFGILFVVYSKSKEPEYSAGLTFMVNDDDGSGGGGLSSILGQFGLAGAGGGSYNYLKIIEISKSEMIMKQVLFDSIDLYGENDLIANHIIELYDLHEDWQEDTMLNGFKFSEEFQGKKEQRVVKYLVAKLRGNPFDNGSNKMLKSKLFEESGILKISGI
ncbi:MAG: Wzz/FepE/Etk N-terminal domain-containing protein, partial [Bacteroidia bacterium]